MLISDVLATGKLPVFVSIVPQKYFVQRIGKDLVDVHVMVRPGANPATYEPKPRQMVAISHANIYFSIGVPFEKAWLNKIAASNPNMRVVHTDRRIQKIPMTTQPSHTEMEHREKGHQQDGILDPHIWLSPPLVKQQAHTILTALQETDPAHGKMYASNYKAFAAEIEFLHAELKNIFTGRGGLRFMVYHPAWGYFARTYDLEQVPIEIEGKDPKPAQLKELITHARETDIKVVFVQPQFSSRSARQVAAEIDGQVAVVDPLALNWLENLRAVADKFKAALR
ncbi:metal ABC transporter solute-binding protein, Zn/Mn family [Thermodesulfobacteriota bacterium]